MSFFSSDERCYSIRVDDFLTVYHSIATKAIVGCKIKGVKHLIASEGCDFGIISIAHTKIQLGVLFLLGAMKTSHPFAEKAYRDAAKKLSTAASEPLDLGPAMQPGAELCPA